MKKKKKSLLSLNKVRIHNLNQLSNIIGGLDDATKDCETYQEDVCICEETLSCRSSAYAPPTGFDDSLNPMNASTQTNGLPGNDCC